ncbi:MAG: sulfurtransferase [Flavobacteriales bacterium]|nr:sulfurtransferase [Flavobacteriales bacterium]
MQEEHKVVDVNTEEFKTELENTRAFADKVRDRMGFEPNPIASENERIYIGLTNNKLTKGKRYCPCFMVEGETKEEKKAANNRICPCKPALQNEIPETGKCYCGIFNTKEYVANFVMVDVQKAIHHTDLTTTKLNTLFSKNEINSAELVDLLDGRKEGLIDFILIDVREELENNTKQIIGMDYLIPTSVFGQKIQMISDKKDKNIVVHCHSGARSARVQQIMKGMGFETVINLSGGISNYGGETK